jgi:hypothetical protein
MKKKCTLLPVMVFAALTAYNQNISSSVIAAAGSSDKTNTILLDWTVGEMAIESVSNNNNWLTQGFHQPLKVIPVKRRSFFTIPEGLYIIKINPNPVRAILNIQVSGATDSKVNIRITDINGKTLYYSLASTVGQTLQVNMSRYASATYLLYIYSSDGKLIDTFKIIKAA